MIGLLLGGADLRQCLPFCGVMLAGYVGKAVFSTCSTAISHTATYYTLRELRKALLDKLSRMPMGTILDTPSGQYKTTIVDRVEGMEPTLAHLIPEMTSNILVPLAIAIYIFCVRLADGLGQLIDNCDWPAGSFSKQQNLCGALAGSCGNGPPYGQRHCGICGRHSSGEGL